MTHPDNDHCGGLVDIAAYLSVREVWMAPGWDPHELRGEASRAARRAKAPLPFDGAIGSLSAAGASPPSTRRRTTEPVNERSLVLLAEVHGRRALLTGDIESGAERELADCCAPVLHADLLKVAHHGSRTSSTEAFLEAVAPRLALISVGTATSTTTPRPRSSRGWESMPACCAPTGPARSWCGSAPRPAAIETPGAPK